MPITSSRSLVIPDELRVATSLRCESANTIQGWNGRSGAFPRRQRAAIGEHSGIAPEQSTGGGTSDGRFIAPLGAEVVELGPVNASIHKVDECVAVEDLSILGRLYRAILSKVLD